MRYRIAQNPAGRYIVLPAPLSVVPIDQTYATQAEAQAEADWLNSIARKWGEVAA
jgi:hypothetical protein